MSLILKGIDLPTNGETLIVGIYGDGNVSIDYSKSLVLAIEPNAEAIQISKGHGRLIDGDALISDLRIYESKYCGEQGYITQDDIIDAPTILEAEETDEFDT